MPALLLRGPQSSDRSFGTSGMNDQFVAAVEAIYDAAPDPSRWPHALDLIGECFGDQDVNLFWQRDDGSRGLIPSTGYNREVAIEYNSTWWKHDIRAIRALERGYVVSGNAQTDRDLVTEAEMETHPFFTQFLALHGMKWLAATGISPDPRVPVAVVINRAASKPAFSDHDLIVLSKLGFHAEKSLRLSVRLFDAEFTSAGLSDAFARLALGIFVLDSLGRIVHSNSAAQRHIGNGFVVTGERLSAAFASDQNALKSALLSMLRASPADLIDDPGPILIRRPNSERPLVTYVLPVRDSQGDAIAQFLVSAKAIVLVVDPDPSEPPDPAIVRDILGLTLSEARLAALVGTGISLHEAAQTLQISGNTARSVLKRVFEKVGVSRQGELSALLTRLVLR
jgi:DNA-binding CsgD family transcriptional regulator/PAS domain-containing protein